jgi:hypothetical protein
MDSFGFTQLIRTQMEEDNALDADRKNQTVP